MPQTPFLRSTLICALLSAGPAFAADPPAKKDAAAPVTVLEPFVVSEARLDDFGFTIGGDIGLFGSKLFVTGVKPNSPVDKAGLRPGDQILKTDGRPPKGGLLTMGGIRFYVAAEQNKTPFVWTFEVRKAGEPNAPIRKLTMTLPTPAPRWGQEQWAAPEGRVPATVTETGPLANLARAVLDNGIWVARWPIWSGPWEGRGSSSDPNASSDGFQWTTPVGFEWTLPTADGAVHRVLVTQVRGKTELVFDVRRPPERQQMSFLTSPTGALVKSWMGFGDAIPADRAREEFQKEVAFWLNDVGRVTGRWPFEVSNPALAVVPGAPSTQAPAQPANAAPKSAAFLNLVSATEDQRRLLMDAFGKLGADEERWSYTETSTGLDDKRTTVVRFDPSRSGDAEATLLKINGKDPKPAEVEKWRAEGRDTAKSLAGLPSLTDRIDTADIRIVADEIASVLFEVPLRSDNKEFPADKSQARFRVNKTTRGFEDLAVKLRDSISVAGVAKVTEAGLEARFQSLDPTLAPQLAYLKAGGAARVLLVKIGRSVESTRTDFRPVVSPNPPPM